MKKRLGISLAQIVSALLIVNYHTHSLEIPILHNIAKCGFIFNTVFVFLSGFLLSLSFSKTPISIGEFFHKRINRIYPSLHIALLTISLIYLCTNQQFTISSLFITTTGFAYFFGINTFGIHLWFISVILVCYILFIPTYKLIVRNSAIFFVMLLSIVFVIFALREESLNGIYNKVSSESLYRLIYHYLIFSIAVYFGIKRSKIFSHDTDLKWILSFCLVFALYIFVQPIPKFGVVAICAAILLAICIIRLIVMASSAFNKYSSLIFFLSAFTYELYLIHYSIIGAIDTIYHGKYIAYPLVFFISIPTAFIISRVAKQYERLTRRCTGRLFRCAP